jgi:hypothetical protein
MSLRILKIICSQEVEFKKSTKNENSVKMKEKDKRKKYEIRNKVQHHDKCFS